MSGTSRAGSYVALLADPLRARTFGLALIGRLGYAVLPLTLLFTFRQATGGFATATAVAALFGATTLVMPIQARLADRFGQRRVLPVCGAGFAAALCAAAAVAARSPDAPAGVWLALAVVLGVFGPALGPSMRAQWRRFVPDGPERVTAYSLDAVCEETLYLLGPIIAATVLAHGPAWVGLILVAALVTIGVAGLALSPAAGAEAHPSDRPDAPASAGPAPLLSLRLFSLLALMVAFGVASALMYTGVAVRADAAGHPAWAGYVESVIGVASVTGGLVWGARAHRRGHLAHLAGAFACFGLGLTLAAAAPGWWSTAAALGVAGLALSPVYTTAFLASDDVTPLARRTEASTWVSTVTNLGSSVGSAAAGGLVGAAGVHAPMRAAAGVALVAAAACAVGVVGARARRHRGAAPTGGGGAPPA